MKFVHNRFHKARMLTRLIRDQQYSLLVVLARKDPWSGFSTLRDSFQINIEALFCIFSCFSKN